MQKLLRVISVILITIMVTSPPAFSGGGFSNSGSSSGGVSDDAYGSGWNGETATAPSKNAIYDKVEALTLGGAVDDTAYGSSWNAVTTIAPSKNAVYDRLQSLVPSFDSANRNLGIGSTALDSLTSGTDNTGFGNLSLTGATSASFNTMVGYGSGYQISATSTYNTGVGYLAMSGPLTAAAIKNTAIGANVMTDLTSGTLNTCVGYISCDALTTGNGNTAMGVDALLLNSTGGANTAFGYYALGSVTSGSNTAFGSNALHDLTTGVGVVGIGYRAGYYQTTGNDSIYIGDETGFSNALYNTANQILIGASVNSNLSNVVVIGNSTATAFGILGSNSPTKSFSLGGTTTRTLGMERHTTSATNGNSLTINAGGATAQGAMTVSPTVTAGGTGYTVQDLLTITGGNGDATVVVSAVSGGVVTSVSRVTNGTGYSSGAGQATTGGTGTGCTLSITVGSSTNKNGGTLNLQPGVSTGTGNSIVSIQGYTKGASGSTDNAVVDRYVVTGAKTLTDAATSLFEIALPTLTMTGGSIDWTIEASDGTDMQSLSGITTFAAVNKGGSYTTTVTNDTANDAKAVSKGTLTSTWAFLTGTNKVTMQVTPAGSLTETIYRVTYTVTNNSPQAITIL